MKLLIEHTTIFAFGAISYMILEILWRGNSHWTMGITGGLCFLILYNVYQHIITAPLWFKCLVGAVIITLIEFIVGCIVNLWLGWRVWDYSARPVNLLGQICILYTGLWFFLSVPIVYFSFFFKKVLFS